MKKLLCWLLTLAMCLSLFPTAALAEEPVGEVALDAPVEDPDAPVGADAPGGPIDDPGAIVGELALDVPADDPDALPAELVADEIQEAVASGDCGDDLIWTLSSDGVLTIAGSGDMWNWSEDGMPWFENQRMITRVRITAGVTSIGDNAFQGCTNLSVVEIPASVTSIRYRAFLGCSNLSSLTIPEGVTSIGEDVFPFCRSLTSVTIPASVTSIGNRAFYYCNYLTKIRFEGAAPSIGVDCFHEVTATAYYPLNDPSWTEEVRQNYGGNITWALSLDGSLEVASGTCGANGDNLTWLLFENGILLIRGSGAMKNWSGSSNVPWYSYRETITDIVLPEGLTSIGGYAFCGCKYVTGMTIPEGVTIIGTGAFYECGSLTSVTIPEGVTRIGGYAFRDCSSLTSVTIPEGVTSIGYCAFNNCSSLTSVTIPASVTSIGDEVFCNCTDLTKIRFEGAAPAFGEYVFGDPYSSPVTATAYYPLNDPTWTEEVRQNYGGTITWVGYEPETPSHVPGDINGDGALSNKDITRLQRYLKDPTTEVNAAALDVNGDGKVNNKDLTRLQRYIKYQDVEIS